MLKLRWFALTLLSALLAVVPAPVFSQPQPPAPTRSAWEESDLFCYMRTSDGRLVNLTQLCQTTRSPLEERSPSSFQGNPPPFAPNASSGSANPSVTVASPAGNPGETPLPRSTAGSCILVDAQGRPCPP